MKILGIDVGGSGIKGAVVDCTKGALVSKRHRIDTPQPATPQSIAAVVEQLRAELQWQGPIGVGFPAAIQHGIARTASNVDEQFIGLNVETLFSEATGCSVFVANDADVAGLAECHFGDVHELSGLVIVVTVGTGLGTALVVDGTLIPNTELGHIWLENGHEAEAYAADSTRKKLKLNWEVWSDRFNTYLTTLEGLFYPDAFIIGGGASKHLEEFRHHLTVNAQVRPAKLLNKAGIVGASLYAQSRLDH